MTPEQEHKAKMALLRVRLDKMIRKAALEQRNHCIENVSFFGLPYRLLMDLQKGKLQPPEQIPLNKFYPQQQMSKKCYDVICQRKLAASPTDSLIYYLAPPEGERESARKLEKEIEQEEQRKEYTPESMREYYFTVFLSLINIDEIKNHEWTGNPIAPAEAERLKKHYKKRLADYEANQGKYSPFLLKADDTTEYPDYFLKIQREESEGKHEESKDTSAGN